MLGYACGTLRERSSTQPTSYPASVHVDGIGLATARDREVWEYALGRDYIIVTKDADFSELSLLLGFPPKVVWIRRGNCSTRNIEELLRENYDQIALLSDNSNTGIIALF